MQKLWRSISYVRDSLLVTNNRMEVGKEAREAQSWFVKWSSTSVHLYTLY